MTGLQLMVITRNLVVHKIRHHNEYSKNITPILTKSTQEKLNQGNIAIRREVIREEGVRATEELRT